MNYYLVECVFRKNGKKYQYVLETESECIIGCCDPINVYVPTGSATLVNVQKQINIKEKCNFAIAMLANEYNKNNFSNKSKKKEYKMITIKDLEKQINDMQNKLTEMKYAEIVSKVDSILETKLKIDKLQEINKSDEFDDETKKSVSELISELSQKLKC